MKFTSIIHGQWIGGFEGSASGSLIVDIEQVSDRICQVYAHVQSLIEPAPLESHVSFEVDAHSLSQKIAVHPQPIVGARLTSWAAVAANYPGVSYPEKVDLSIVVDGDSMRIEWTEEGGFKFTGHLRRSRAALQSELKSELMDWRTFKDAVISIPHRHFIFRGQSTRHRLRTTFHRSGRNNLAKFIVEDTKELHRHLTARSRHIFDLSVPDQNGAFLALCQHHGYPTPLLDWSYSPFVASFFAFEAVSAGRVYAPDDFIRVFLFDARAWKARLTQLSNLVFVGPHLSIGEFLAIDNDRLLPQQSVSTISNVDDIEDYITFLERKTDMKFLRAIDIPCSERSIALQELAMMGITRGALFPGFDGACAELRARFFPD
jgi:hypothetical protein